MRKVRLGHQASTDRYLSIQRGERRYPTSRTLELVIEKVALLRSDDRHSVGGQAGVDGSSSPYQATLTPRVLRVLSAQVCEDSEGDFVRIIASLRPSGRALIITQDIHRKYSKSTKENTVRPS